MYYGNISRAVGDLTHQRFDADARADTVATADGTIQVDDGSEQSSKTHQNKTKEHLGEIVYFHKFPTRNRELRRKLTEKWYRVITGYKWNSEYNKDRDADGVVTKHTSTTYAHLVGFRTLKQSLTITSEEKQTCTTMKQSTPWSKNDYYTTEHTYTTNQLQR